MMGNRYIEAASNVTTGNGSYTEENFKEDYPQFYHTVSGSLVCWIPSGILTSFVAQANAQVQPEKWCELSRQGAGLLVAHKATLYLRSYKAESASAAEAAASGQVIGTVKTATMGDTSVSYDDAGAIRGTELWGDLNATSYGQQLASLARLVGMGGSYCL